MKKIFKRYAKYLRENHLEELGVKNLEISKTMDIPLMRLFNHLTDEQLLEMGKPVLEDILLSIENETFWEKTEETYKQWKEDKLKDDQICGKHFLPYHHAGCDKQLKKYKAITD